jgi:hypothetical protein
MLSGTFIIGWNFGEAQETECFRSYKIVYTACPKKRNMGESYTRSFYRAMV